MQWWESVVGIRGTTSSHEKEWWCRGWLSIGDYELNTKEYKRKQDHFRKKVHKQRQRWENARHCTGKEDSDVVTGQVEREEAGKASKKIRLMRALYIRLSSSDLIRYQPVLLDLCWAYVCLPLRDADVKI